MMKKILSTFILIALVFFSAKIVKAQTFGNEWINYSQNYYKFKVVGDSIYRIPISSLTALGMPNTVLGDNIQLFREGVEMPIFVSTTGVLGASDFIEFYGEKATGSIDLPLYKTAEDQLNPSQSLLSDTAFYFITYNSSINNKRYVSLANNLTNPPTKENYFWDKFKINYRVILCEGPSYYGESSSSYLTVTSSQFEHGEGWAKSNNANNDSVTFTCLFPYTSTGAPSGLFKSIVAGNSYLQTHEMKIFANGNAIVDSTFSLFSFTKMNAAVPMNFLNAQNKITFKYTPLNQGQIHPDRYSISSIEFRYPRQFNFSNKTGFYFELDPKATDYYIEISNFNNATIAPKLYDISSNQYILGDISSPGLIRFVIPASPLQAKKLFLQSLAITNFPAVADLHVVNFKNYSLASNQGDYLLIAHKGMMDDGSGSDYIEEYKNYRISAQGGAYNAIKIDVQNIYDEFGYGYNFHAQGIKNFLHYAVANSAWSAKPKQVFLIGKGFSYKNYLNFSAAPFTTYPFYPIPSFGDPCSDILLTDFDKTDKPAVPIGRLSAFNGSEVKSYLDKIKDHESAIANTSMQTSDSILWRKRILHLAGAKDAAEQAPIVNSLLGQENIIKKTYYGAQVFTLKKGSTSSVETANSQLLDSLFNTGIGLIQFFGHSSSSTMDYNLDFPSQYHNYKRYPLFIANGCGAGNIFILTGTRALDEQFVLQPNAGAIAFVASNNTGLTNSLSTYTDSLYNEFAFKNYGNTISKQINSNVNTFMNNPFYLNDNLLRLHCEQIGLNGDPACSLFSYPKPDYAIEDKGVKFKQLNLTTNYDSLDVDITFHNLGKYTKDSISLLVKRILPNNAEEIILYKKYEGVANEKMLSIKIPTNGNLGIGINNLILQLDQEGTIDEISENNNSIIRTFDIYNDDLVPVYPYEFSIVSQQGITLKASTLNPFVTARNYWLQIDTTEKFNSPSLLSTPITSTGGVIKWIPPITLKDSTVYYWRTAMDTSSATGNTKFKWTNSSFIYLDQSSAGWNQSHYFQYRKNNFNDITLDSNSRELRFNDLNKKLQTQTTCMNGPSPYTYIWPDNIAKINGSTLFTFGCDPYPGFSSLQFIVIDSLTGEPWINTVNQSTGLGRFGSFAPCRISPDNISFEDPFFEFSFLTTASRKKIMDFIDSIPHGFYFLMQPRLCVGGGCGGINTINIKQWKSDTTAYGSGVSLYHKLFNYGYTKIDSFTKNRPMVFWSRKDIPSTIQQYIGIDSTQKLYAEFDFSSSLYTGDEVSTKVGPANIWNHFYRKLYSKDLSAGDTSKVDIYGIDVQGHETLLVTVTGPDTTLQFIDAKTYPSLRLVLNTNDNIFATPEQMRYWRVLYDPVPEAALNPNRLFTFQDTVGQGQPQPLRLAIENLTALPMDSMLVNYDVIDSHRNKFHVGSKRYAPLTSLDTLQIQYDINTAAFTGKNTLVIEANPNNDQKEQYHPNNIGYKDFYVVPDNKNPIIDVTFDGVHILNKDIVSSKPFIHILLKDENKYLALDDTSLVQVYVKYHNDNIEHQIPFDGNVMKFIPADPAKLSSKNQAQIEFKPEFLVDGDDYMLIVHLKDKIGNGDSKAAYKVDFSIVTKPSISSVVNYPNPFTTSTQFIFTLTGFQIPSNLKIQILSVTGKIVREITKDELGNLHIGRNITPFKWKGDDQYGQPLGNGVYLYRVVSTLNGNKMDHYAESGNNADKWIEKGYGKLYIMR